MQGADNQSRRVLNGAAVIAFHQQCLALPGWPKAGVAPDGHALDQAPATDDTQVLQPVMRVEIHVPSVYAGGLVPLVSGKVYLLLELELSCLTAASRAFILLL